MRTLTFAALAAGTLVATPVVAQNGNPQQMLQGLLSGNQSQDQAVRQAYERGYQAGRQDEARMAANNGGNRPYQNQSRSNGNSYNGNGQRGFDNNTPSGNNSNYPASSYGQNRGN